MRLLFPHIPKCAGNSIKSQIQNSCRVVLDYTNHPTWQSQLEREKGFERQNHLKKNLRQKDDWIVFGHFGVSQYFDVDWDLAIILLRKPEDRIYSHYRFFKQKISFNSTTISRHPELEHVRNGEMTINDFASIDHNKNFLSDYYLRDIAKFRNRSVFLDLDDFSRSCRIISGILNLQVNSGIHENKTKRDESYNLDASIIQKDIDLYKELTS